MLLDFEIDGYAVYVNDNGVDCGLEFDYYLCTADVGDGGAALQYSGRWIGSWGWESSDAASFTSENGAINFARSIAGVGQAANGIVDGKWVPVPLF
jgi:hypothetical protein